MHFLFSIIGQVEKKGAVLAFGACLVVAVSPSPL